jgi:hypothetical protein
MNWQYECDRFIALYQIFLCITWTLEIEASLTKTGTGFCTKEEKKINFAQFEKVKK